MVLGWRAYLSKWKILRNDDDYRLRIYVQETGNFSFSRILFKKTIQVLQERHRYFSSRDNLLDDPQVCLGFVQNFDSKGQPQEVTNEYILSGDYEVNVAGIMYPAKCHLHSPNLPTKFPDKERDAYHATRDQQSL